MRLHLWSLCDYILSTQTRLDWVVCSACANTQISQLGGESSCTTLHGHTQRCLNSSLTCSEQHWLWVKGKERLLECFQEYSLWLTLKSPQGTVWFVHAGSTAGRILSCWKSDAEARAGVFERGRLEHSKAPKERVACPHLAILSPCVGSLCLIHMIPLGLWFLKHESSAEQATGAGSQPVSAHLQCCAGSSVPKWTSRPQTNLDPRPLSFLIPLSDSQLLSAVMKAASQAKRVLLDSSTIDKVSHVKASRHSWFRAAKQNSGFLWVLVLLNYVQHHIALMLLVSQLLNGGAFNIHF